MIQVNPLENSDRMPIGVEAYGHSAWYQQLHQFTPSVYSGARKSEPVCLAVSVLLDNLMLSLQNLVFAKTLVHKGSGYFFCIFMEADSDTEKKGVRTAAETNGPARVLLQSAVFGLVNLAKQFPNQVSVKESEVISPKDLTQKALQFRMERVTISI